MFPQSRLKLYTSLKQYFIVFSSYTSLQFDRGDYIKKLIFKFKSLTKKKFIIPVSTARVGIYLVLRSILKKNQQEVILSPYTIADVVNMVIAAGGIPIFCDINRKTCNIDPKKVEKLINKNTAAIMITHFYGEICNISEIEKISKKFNIPFIEDAAQALGAEYNKKMAGTFGIAGIYSFGMYKNINAFYGGLIITDDKKLAKNITLEIKTWPTQSKIHYFKKLASGIATDLVTNRLFFGLFFFRFFRWAFIKKIDFINNKLKIDVNPKLCSYLPESYKFNMSQTQARLILLQINNLKINTKLRIKAAMHWHDGLKGNKFLILPKFTKNFSHMYWYFPIQFDKRNLLVAHVLKSGNDITESYHRNCANLKCFSDFKRNCPNAEKTANSLIYLPTYPGFNFKQLSSTVSSINSYFSK